MTYSKADGSKSVVVFYLPNVWDHFVDGMHPATQVREGEPKEVVEEVEEEVEDAEDPTKKVLVKKKVTTMQKVKIVEVRPYEMTLNTMLDFDCSRFTTNDVAEMCTFADCFDEMLQRDFGNDILKILREKASSEEQKDKKRAREEEEAEATKKQKTEDGEAKPVEAKETKETKEAEVKPKFKIQHNVNKEMLVPFQYFDKQAPSGAIQGYLKRECFEGLMYRLGPFTKNEVADLMTAANLKQRSAYQKGTPPVLYYVKLATSTVEVPIPEEPEKEEKAAEETAAMDEDSKEEAVPRRLLPKKLLKLHQRRRSPRRRPRKRRSPRKRSPRKRLRKLRKSTPMPRCPRCC